MTGAPALLDNAMVLDASLGDAMVLDAPVGDAMPVDVSVSCPEFLQRPAGLSYHLTRGTCDGYICTWDYDPVGKQLTRINGAFDPHAGTFWWQESFHDRHWRLAAAVSGTGQIQADGREISSFTVTTTDMLDVTTVAAVQQQRIGCNLSRTTTNASGQMFVLQGTFATTFTYTEDQIPTLWTGGDFPVQATGARTNMGTVSETFATPSPVGGEFWWMYSHTLTGDADGNTSVVFDQWNHASDWDREGTCDWDIAGTQTCVVQWDTEDWGGDAEWTVDYAGDGTGGFSAFFYDPGTGDFYPQDCPITFSSWACSWTCPDGQSSNCRTFLME